MTLLVRDEADIVDACLRYHLDAGVDLVIATDHGSVDGTSDVLRGYERSGHVRLIRESGPIDQRSRVSRMARMAATEHGADWVLNVDADEFWWPRRGTLKELLEAVPARFGAVRALQRHFVPRVDGQPPFYRHMVARVASHPDPHELYHAQVKVAHRGSPDVVVIRGNHDAYGRELRLLREWFPIEVFHFPVRSAEQLARKIARRRGDAPARHVARLRAAIAERGRDRVFAELAVDDTQLAREVADGSLAIDMRLCGVLAREERAPDLPEGVAPETALASETAYVADIATFTDTDARIRAERRVRELDARVRELETPLHARTTAASRRIRRRLQLRGRGPVPSS
jgi:hypothetical protein